ncbi:unnamed protein product [Pleuronectes platessa]|uniref:Uncharacterized protein n=1 Tax=Pleuronectes platessa TaxID=8262 RepID=A0A9N7YDD3_PLEPL|nr:unnamed protein product [Pleuronectes platessa]
MVLKAEDPCISQRLSCGRRRGSSVRRTDGGLTEDGRRDTPVRPRGFLNAFPPHIPPSSPHPLRLLSPGSVLSFADTVRTAAGLLRSGLLSIARGGGSTVIMVSAGLLRYLAAVCALCAPLQLPQAQASYYPPHSGECRGKGKECTECRGKGKEYTGRGVGPMRWTSVSVLWGLVPAALDRCLI